MTIRPAKSPRPDVATKVLGGLLPEDWEWAVASRAVKPLLPAVRQLALPPRVRARIEYNVEATVRDVLGDPRGRRVVEKEVARRARAEAARDLPKKTLESRVARSARSAVQAWIAARLPAALARARAEIARDKKETDTLLARIAAMDARALHRFAGRWNWDDGSYAPDAVVRHPACALGTALLVYWFAAPVYFTQWRTARASDDPETFAMLAYIEGRIASGGYPHAGIAFDPRHLQLTEASLREDEPKRRELPAQVFAATTRGGVVGFAPPPTARRTRGA